MGWKESTRLIPFYLIESSKSPCISPSLWQNQPPTCPSRLSRRLQGRVPVSIHPGKSLLSEEFLEFIVPNRFLKNMSLLAYPVSFFFFQLLQLWVWWFVTTFHISVGSKTIPVRHWEALQEERDELVCGEDESGGQGRKS